MKCTEKQLSIKGNDVCYVDEGPQDGPALIFIHGFPFNKAMWRKQLSAFEKTHRVIAYDIRGHGGSALGTAEFSIVQFADDLLHFMDALSLKKATVCGLSWVVTLPSMRCRQIPNESRLLYCVIHSARLTAPKQGRSD